MTDAVEVEIVRLGAQGDGVADTEDGPRFVPFALPGERWRLGGDGAPTVRLTESPERAAPLCRHFGRCGGCIAQHMGDNLYAQWKHGIVAEAFAHRGLEAEVLPLIRIAPRSRRRAFLGIERNGGTTRIGFREEGKHDLVDIAECPVLDPAIVAALPHLKDIARLAMPERQSGRLIVTKADAGLDVSFDNGFKALLPEVRAELARLAASAGILRLVVAGDLIAERAPPVVTLGGAGVVPLSSIFLQAVPEAEAELTRLVIEALPRKAKRVADLFSGAGTFTFPLARHAKVLAVDGDKRAMQALQTALRHATGLKPIEVKLRDLFREPLSPKELEGFDCVVFDPPRAGAAAQAERLAKSKVPVIVAVSCNPATLARDARTLVDGGYRMGPVTPVDQFLYTPHVEAVARFERG